MVLATGVGPSDLLAAPPAVYNALVQVLEEREREEKKQRLRDKARGMLGKKA